MIPGDSGKFEQKGGDKNKRTCMFDARIVHESKYLSTIFCPQFNITILQSWSTI